MRARRLLLYLVLTGLLARALYLGQVAALPFFHDPVGDSARYLERAREIAHGTLLGDRPFFYGGILYPWLLALDLVVFGGNLYPVCLLQAFAGCALAWVIYRFALAAAGPGELSSGPAVGLVAAAMAVFYGPFAFFEADILMISWTLLLVMTGAVLALRAIDRPAPLARVGRLACAGLCLGLAATERPNLLPLIPALGIWAMVYSPRFRRVGAGLAAIAGGAAVLLAVAALNHAASGRWVLLTTSSGINFSIGNHPGASGTFEEPWSDDDPEFAASHPDLEESSLLMARRLSGRDLDAVEASRFWFDRGVDFLRTRPKEALDLYSRKLLLFWNGREVPNHLDFIFMRTVAPALWLMPLTFALIAPAGLYGLASPEARRLLRRPAIVLLGLLIVVPMATVMPFFVADRYRAPVVPALMVTGACGLVSLWRMLGARLTRRRASLHLACAALLGLALSRPIGETDISRDYWMMAQAFRKQGEPAQAADYYERAIRVSPADPLLHNGLGGALEQLGQVDRAEAEYRRAIELRPALSLPHRNLGLILMRRGPASGEEAYQNLMIAERSGRGDLEVAKAMAALLLARGDAPGARARALEVLRVEPRDPAAQAVLRATGGPGP